MKAHLLYKTDSYNRIGSEELIAVCSSRDKAISFAQDVAKKDDEEFTSQDLKLLNTLGITVDRKMNFQIFTVDIDEIIL